MSLKDIPNYQFMQDNEDILFYGPFEAVGRFLPRT